MEHGLAWREYLRRFTHEDRNLVVAVMLEKGQECAMCGTAPWQWREDPAAYVAIVHSCPGCAAKDRLRASIDASQPGTSVRLVTPDTVGKMSTAPRRRPLSPREKARLAT